MMDKVRVLVVDDEPIAREGIRVQLEAEPDVVIIGECANGLEAVTAIQEQNPDVVFLDVQMPELDGFGVLEAVSERMPAVVFVTAYDQYAIRAFEAAALDYLLKPFTRERFLKAFHRAKAHIQGASIKEFNHRIQALLESLPTEQKYLERLVVKSAGRVFFLSVEEVDWIEAADNYVLLHVGRESHLLHGTMSKLEAKLDPSLFLRVHRSKIINIQRVKELQPLFQGEYAITLRDGTRLTSGRGYRAKLQQFLVNPL